MRVLHFTSIDTIMIPLKGVSNFHNLYELIQDVVKVLTDLSKLILVEWHPVGSMGQLIVCVLMMLV